MNLNKSSPSPFHIFFLIRLELIDVAPKVLLNLTQLAQFGDFAQPIVSQKLDTSNWQTIVTDQVKSAFTL